MTPFRAYDPRLVVSVDPTGSITVSARPGVADHVRVTPLNETGEPQILRPDRQSDLPDPELVDRGVTGIPISSVAVSAPDPQGRRRIAIADDEGHVDVFDAVSLRPLYSLPRLNYPATSMEFTPGGRGLMTVGSRGAWMWDAETGVALRALPSGQAILAGAQILPGGLQVITGNQNGTGALWNMRDMNDPYAPRVPFSRPLPRHDSPITALAAAPRTPLVASGDADGRVTIAGPNGRLVTNAFGDAEIMSLNFSLDGQSILATQADGNGRVFDTQSGTNPVVIPAAQYGGISAGYLLRNGRLALTSHADGRGRLWEVERPVSGRRNARLIAEYDAQSPLTGLLMLPREGFLTTGEDGTVRRGQVPRQP